MLIKKHEERRGGGGRREERRVSFEKGAKRSGRLSEKGRGRAEFAAENGVLAFIVSGIIAGQRVYKRVFRKSCPPSPKGEGGRSSVWHGYPVAAVITDLGRERKGSKNK